MKNGSSLSAYLPWQILGLMALAFSCQAADVPRPVQDDLRIRVAQYSPNQVYQIRVKRGVSTRIIFAPGEAITTASPGLSSRCGNDLDEWCIHAPEGGNQIVIRPRDGAQETNLEVQTNLRDYSFEIKVLMDGKPEKESPENVPFFRVSFEYPSSPAAAKAALLASVIQGASPLASSGSSTSVPDSVPPEVRLAESAPVPRNDRYTMQTLPGGEIAAPSAVFDDGRFTYFEFRGSREIPAAFVHGTDGEQRRANFHFDTQRELLVVHSTAQRFTLRLGKAVVGIFNEAFDGVGVSTPTGTVVSGVLRERKDNKQ